MPGDSWAASVNASCPVRTFVVWALDLDCTDLSAAECLAADAPTDTRQKIVQIRIWLLRKRYMEPLGDFDWKSGLPDISIGKDAECGAGEAREMLQNEKGRRLS